MADALALLSLLIGLELVLGVDNILVISIFVADYLSRKETRQEFWALVLPYLPECCCFTSCWNYRI